MDRSGCEKRSAFVVGVKCEGDLLDGVSDFLDGEERFSDMKFPDAPLFEVFSELEKIDFKTVTRVLSFSVKSVRPVMLDRLTFIPASISPLLYLVFFLSSFFLNSILAKVTPLVGHEDDFGTFVEPLFTNIPVERFPSCERLPRFEPLRLFILGSKGDFGRPLERLREVVVIDFIMAMVVTTS